MIDVISGPDMTKTPPQIFRAKVQTQGPNPQSILHKIIAVDEVAVLEDVGDVP